MKNESMLEFKFTQIGKTSGDETTPYMVSLNKECSVSEFIDRVLKRNEWGYIGIRSHGHIFGSPAAIICWNRFKSILYSFCMVGLTM